MTKIISCPYCDSFNLRKPELLKEELDFRIIMTEHCTEEHLEDIVWDVVKSKLDLSPND